jgi:hypothetical protein
MLVASTGDPSGDASSPLPLVADPPPPHAARTAAAGANTSTRDDNFETPTELRDRLMVREDHKLNHEENEKTTLPFQPKKRGEAAEGQRTQREGGFLDLLEGPPGPTKTKPPLPGGEAGARKR